MSRRRRNQQGINWGLVAGVGAGLVVIGTVGYLVGSSRLGKKALDVVDESGLRIPDPSFAMELPENPEQFMTLDELVCECGAPIVKTASESTDLQTVVDAISDCVVKKLYPQFPWPTVTGDHPSVAQLQTEVGVLARRAVVSAEICPGGAKS
jgi:hypothetical protein